MRERRAVGAGASADTVTSPSNSNMNIKSSTIAPVRRAWADVAARGTDLHKRKLGHGICNACYSICVPHHGGEGSVLPHPRHFILHGRSAFRGGALRVTSVSIIKGRRAQMPPPQMSLAELHNIGKKKQQVRTQCFDKVVELCHRRIKTVAQYGAQNAFYEIPGILLGYPLFDVKECARYVVDALRKNGFLVQLIGTDGQAVEGIIYISWDPKELRGPPRPKLGGNGRPADAGPSASARALLGPFSTRALPKPVRLF